MSNKPGNINAPVPYEYKEYPKMVGGKIVNSKDEEMSLPSAADLDAVAAEMKAREATAFTKAVEELSKQHGISWKKASAILRNRGLTKL